MKVTDEIIMVETGGDYALNYKKGSDKFGFVGTSIHTKGDGIETFRSFSTYVYDTAVLI